jgi:uncharacterized damage-inducible protein DinB
MDSDNIRTLYEYNRWANDKTFDSASRVGPDEYTKDMHSGHRSVRDTFVHVVSVEWLYLHRVRGDSPNALWSPSNFPSLANLRDRWVELTREQMTYVAGLTNEQLEKEITYTNLSAKPMTYPLWQILQHGVNHSTYHRGQIAAMLRQLGARPEPTDLLLFYDLQS